MIWPLSQISNRVPSFEAPVSLTRMHYGNILNLRLHLYCSLHLLVVSGEDGPHSSLPQTSQPAWSLPFLFTNNYWQLLKSRVIKRMYVSFYCKN